MANRLNYKLNKLVFFNQYALIKLFNFSVFFILYPSFEALIKIKYLYIVQLKTHQYFSFTYLHKNFHPTFFYFIKKLLIIIMAQYLNQDIF